MILADNALFHSYSKKFRILQIFARLKRDHYSLFASVRGCKISLYVPNFSKILFLLPSEISTDNTSEKCNCWKLLFYCRQKFLTATKALFLKSLDEGDYFCTIACNHSLKTCSAHSFEGVAFLAFLHIFGFATFLAQQKLVL